MRSSATLGRPHLHRARNSRGTVVAMLWGGCGMTTPQFSRTSRSFLPHTISDTPGITPEKTPSCARISTSVSEDIALLDDVNDPPKSEFTSAGRQDTLLGRGSASSAALHAAQSGIERSAPIFAESRAWPEAEAWRVARTRTLDPGTDTVGQGGLGHQPHALRSELVLGWRRRTTVNSRPRR